MFIRKDVGHVTAQRVSSAGSSSSSFSLLPTPVCPHSPSPSADLRAPICAAVQQVSDLAAQHGATAIGDELYQMPHLRRSKVTREAGSAGSGGVPG